MKVATGRQRSIQSVIDLLQNPEFCQDARRIIEAAKPFYAQAPSPEEWQRLVVDLVEPFGKRWGVVPPTSGALLDLDPRREPAEAIGAGCWGIVLLSTQTTNREIRARIKSIRNVIRKRHRDALDLRRVQLARWLEEFREEEFPHFTRSAIARAVFGRRTGLRRPTKTQAVKGLPMNEEQRLWEKYREAGVPADKIEQRIYRKLRGSEAPASAALRMSQSRYLRWVEQRNEALATPIQSEPLSYALTHLFRALLDESDATVRQRAIDVRNAFVGASVPERTKAEQRDEASQHQPPEALESTLWGLVPVFSWTKDLDVQASVKKLRIMMRQQARDGADLTPATRPNQFEPLSDALLSLFRALADREDVVVRRQALEARATLLRGASC